MNAERGKSEDAVTAPGNCIAHGEQDGPLDENGRARCPVVITDPHDCGYGDPCGRFLLTQVRP